MDQHVQADLLLEPDGAGDFLAAERLVLLGRPLALLQGRPGLADLGRLRERADRGGGQRAAGERLPLGLAPLGERRRAAEHRLVDGARRRPTSGLWIRGDALRRSTRLAAGRQVVGHGRPALVIARARAAISPSFCLAKASQPFNSASSASPVRDRSGSASSEQEGPTSIRSGPIRSAACSTSRQRAVQIGPPDVAAVDHAQRKHHARGGSSQGAIQLFRGADQVEMHCRHRQLQGCRRLSRRSPK